MLDTDIINDAIRAFHHLDANNIFDFEQGVPDS
jgi:hypothetical protein